MSDSEHLSAAGNRQVLQANVEFVDPNFFTTIRLPFIEGDPRSALSEPESVVLSQSAAKEYFGDTDPMGRALTTNRRSCPKDAAACRGQIIELRVTGVVRDLPQNTQLSGDVFIPVASLADSSTSERQNWTDLAWYTYVILAPGVQPETVLAAMPSVLNQDLTPAVTGVPWPGGKVYSLHIARASPIHALRYE